MKYPPKMPQKTYPTTLEEQLEDLKTDVLAVRFAESRVRQSSMLLSLDAWRMKNIYRSEQQPAAQSSYGALIRHSRNAP